MPKRNAVPVATAIAATTATAPTPAPIAFTPCLVDPTQILTMAEVAGRLKVSKRWVYEKCRHRCQNPLPAIRIGRYLRFDWGDVSAWLCQQKTAR
jgi:excisionase family DNA binding protein